MNINYLSDLHLESRPLEWVVPDETDVVVIAGDVWNGDSTLRWLEELAHKTRQPIIYVPGNHCFWGNNLHTWPDKARTECMRFGVDFLYNDTVTIKDTVFIGTTLWTDFSALGNQPLKLIQARDVMNDYRWINGVHGRVTPDEILAEHVKARSFLERALPRQAGLKRCVVTHHAPSKRSLPARYSDSRYTPYYVSDLEQLLLDHEPEVYVHGHIHASVQYFVGETMVITNPRGHLGVHGNTAFMAEAMLEF
jgi:predicted phosphodiesterase